MTKNPHYKADANSVGRMLRRTAELHAEANEPKAEVYFKGFAAKYTGVDEIVYGGHFYEIVLLEGPDKGKTRLVTKAPEVR